jgi:hypothetical protein
MLDNDVIEYVSNYKYLGIYLDEHLSFSETIDTLSASGSRALGSIINKYKRNNHMGFNTYRSLFDTGVAPIMDYCCAIFAHKNCDKIDQIQQRAMRIYLGVNKYTPLLGITGDMGWEPGEIRRKINTLRYWNRLIKLDDNRLTKQVFLYDYVTNNVNSWNPFVKKIFKQLEKVHIYESMLPCNLDEAKKQLIASNEVKWKANIEIKAKLRFYKKFKINLETEKYVVLNLSPQSRSYLAQLRFGVLPLAVETGRYRSVPLNDRLCEICDQNKVEDEIHFLFFCTKYVKYRNIWFHDMGLNLNCISEPVQEKLLLDVFRHERATSRYVVTCMQIRKDTLHN